MRVGNVGCSCVYNTETEKYEIECLEHKQQRQELTDNTQEVKK